MQVPRFADPAAWVMARSSTSQRSGERMLAAVGPQTAVPATDADPIDDELDALKERLRRQGRIK